MSNSIPLRQRLSQIPRCAVHDEFDQLSDPANHTAICDRLLLFLHNTSRALSSSTPSDHFSYLQAGPEIVEISRYISRIQAILPKLECVKSSQAIATVASVGDQVARYQHKLAIASQYDDLCNTVLEQLLVEVTQALSSIDISHPFAEYKTIDLKSLVTSSSQDIPTYNQSEQTLFNSYLQAKERVPMLLFAINAAREQVAAISHVLGDEPSFPDLANKVREKLAQVESEWMTLSTNLDKYFSSNIRPRLSNVVQNILVESILACRHILVGKMTYEDKVASHKLCARAVHLARKHMVLLSDESDSLALYWARLNPQYERMLEYMELLQLTASGSSALNFSQNKGLDLHIDVCTHSVPFSVKRISNRSPYTATRQLQPTELFKNESLNISIDEDYDEYDTATLVSKTPRILLETDFKPRPSQRTHTRIPRIVPNYAKLHYPMIAKVGGYLRIPTISASHPVFQSPQKCKSRPVHASNTRMQLKDVNSQFPQLQARDIRKNTRLEAPSVPDMYLNSERTFSSSHSLLQPPPMLDPHPSYVSTLRTPSMNSPLQSALLSPLSVSTTPQHGSGNGAVDAKPPSYPLFMQSPVTPIDITERGLPRPNFRIAMEKSDWYSP